MLKRTGKLRCSLTIVAFGTILGYCELCKCNDCVPACMVGLGGGGAQYGGNGVVFPVHRYRMFRLAGGSRDVFPALDGGAGVGHEGIFKSCLWRSCEQMCVLSHTC